MIKRSYKKKISPDALNTLKEQISNNILYNQSTEHLHTTTDYVANNSKQYNESEIIIKQDAPIGFPFP
ncbi:hypothetical protein ABSA28_00112 [Candidatus Hepatincolaceae symbiont of Richtersius coronifer]